MKWEKLVTLFSLLVTSCINHSVSSKELIAIDPPLKAVAKQLKTTVETDVGGSSFDNITVPKTKLAARRISWTTDSIGKAILIHQNFENRNIDTPDWDFMIVAWDPSLKSGSKGHPFWQKYLLQKVKFEKIEKDIDSLLNESLIKLAAVSKTDLGYN